MTDQEWYFFCKRGRKYRNSVRPNRVTGSGFWKATGIDKPIYSVEGHGRCDCVGLKKSLVYYRGSAGKGTKTDWMMHEFRLPADQKNTTPPNAKAAAQEAVREKHFPKYLFHELNLYHFLKISCMLFNFVILLRDCRKYGHFVEFLSETCHTEGMHQIVYVKK